MPFHGPSTNLHVSRRGWIVLAALVLLPWAFVFWLTGQPRNDPPRSATPAPSTPTPPPTRASAAAERSPRGRWGQLEATRILIEPPEDFIPAFFTTPQPLQWTFKGYSAAQLTSLWQQAGLTPAQQSSLEAPAARTVRADAIVIAPPAETVRSLTPEARARIYSVLALAPENIPQRDPFRTRAELADDWFYDSTLPEDIVALTRGMFYRRNASMLFADHDLVLPRLAASSDRVRFIKTLSRKSALLVHLQVAHGEDVEALTRYWGGGRRSKDVRPLLQSLAHQPQGGTIDLVHLLPPFARALLYTYPVPLGNATDAARDCHWTSLNFYSPRPDDRYADLQVVQHTLLNDYYLVSGEPELGDIVMLVEPGGRGVHSCVYIADDIVFTKNGAAFSVPWLFSPLNQVVSFYSLTEPLEIRRYRAREK